MTNTQELQEIRNKIQWECTVIYLVDIMHSYGNHPQLIKVH